MNKQQQAHALLTRYETNYSKKYRRKPVVNRYAEKWGMTDMIDSFGYEKTKEILDYYFKTGKEGHPLSFFFSNAHHLLHYMVETEQDEKRRKAIREQTRIRVEQESQKLAD